MALCFPIAGGVFLLAVITVAGAIDKPGIHDGMFEFLPGLSHRYTVALSVDIEGAEAASWGGLRVAMPAALRQYKPECAVGVGTLP